VAPLLLGAAGGLAAPHGGVLRHWSEEPSGGRVRLGGEGRQPGRDGGVARGLRRVPGASSCWRLGYAREDRNGKTRHGLSEYLVFVLGNWAGAEVFGIGLKN